MSVKDVIKNSVYESLGGGTGLSFQSIMLILMISCFIGLYIYFVYKNTSKAAFYSKDLNITLAGMTIVVSAILLAMQSNLIVSLGMVGALSIVRFRNAIKNPLDLLYLFWSISAGIICGVGLYLLAILLCVIMTVLLLFLEILPDSKAPSLLVIRAGQGDIDWDAVRGIIKQNSKYFKEKSKSIKNKETEIIIELRTNSEDALLKELESFDSITSLNFLSHDGEYRI